MSTAPMTLMTATASERVNSKSNQMPETGDSYAKSKF